MGYVVIAHVVMAHVVMAHVVMANILMAFVKRCTSMAVEGVHSNLTESSEMAVV